MTSFPGTTLPKTAFTGLADLEYYFRRNAVPDGNACRNLNLYYNPTKCSDCEKFYDGTMNNDDDGKCVWMPHVKKCWTKKKAIEITEKYKKNKKKLPMEYTEFCTDQQCSDCKGCSFRGLCMDYDPKMAKPDPNGNPGMTRKEFFVECINGLGGLDCSETNQGNSISTDCQKKARNCVATCSASPATCEDLDSMLKSDGCGKTCPPCVNEEMTSILGCYRKECRDSDECTDYNNPFCDSGACIQCNGRSCTAQQPYCVNDNCVECRRNDDCVDGIEAAHPYCVDDTCVECVQNSDCSSGACNTSSGRCYNYKGWVWCTGDYISSHPTLESAIEACSRNSSCGCIGDRYCDGYSYHTVVGTARYVDPKKSCSWVAP